MMLSLKNVLVRTERINKAKLFLKFVISSVSQCSKFLFFAYVLYYTD